LVLFERLLLVVVFFMFFLYFWICGLYFLLQSLPQPEKKIFKARLLCAA
jgi:hypothetical protein